MKNFAVLFLVFAIASVNAGPIADDNSNLAQEVKDVIDAILGFLPKKIAITAAEFDIPENDLVKGVVTINEISVGNINTPNIEEVTYDDATSRLDYELNFEGVHVIVDLEIVLEGLIDLDHHLSAVFHLQNLDGKGYAIIAEDPTEVTDFSLLIAVEKIMAEVDGLLDDDELSKQVTDEINENGAQAVDDFLEEISPEASELIKDLINIIIDIVNS